MTLDRQLASQEPTKLARTPIVRVPLPLAAVALIIAAVPFVVHAWVALHGYFGQDDFLIVYRASRGDPADLGFLFQNYNGHVSPGMFLIAWAATGISPLNYPVLVLPLLVAQAYASVLLWRLLIDLFGRRWALLVPFAFYTFSPIILFSALWWSYGVTLIPLLLTMFGALRAHVRYLRTGARRYAVLALLWTLAGLAFYEKAVLFVGLLFGITVLLAPKGERNAVRWALRRHWQHWAVGAALVVGYAALYAGLTGGTARDSATDSQIPELARRMVLDSFLVPTSGFPVSSWIMNTADLTPPPAAVQLLITLMAAALVFAGVIVGGRRAVYAWLLLAGYLVMDIVLVVVARLSRLGAIIGTDCRYIADAVPVAVLCATFAFLTPRPLEEVRAAEAGWRPSTPVRVAAVGLTVLMMIGATISSVRLAPALTFTEARGYVATARAAFAQDPGIVLYDGSVPDAVMIHWFGEEARASRVIGALPGAPRFNLASEKLYVLDGMGVPHLVDRMINTVTTVPGPAKDCGYPVTERITFMPLTKPVLGRRVMRLEYYTAETGDGLVGAPEKRTRVTFERGLHVLYVPLDGLFGQVNVSRLGPAEPVCIGNVLIGEPVT